MSVRLRAAEPRRLPQESVPPRRRPSRGAKPASKLGRGQGPALQGWALQAAASSLGSTALLGCAWLGLSPAPDTTPAPSRASGWLGVPFPSNSRPGVGSQHQAPGPRAPQGQALLQPSTLTQKKKKCGRRNIKTGLNFAQ